MSLVCRTFPVLLALVTSAVIACTAPAGRPPAGAVLIDDFGDTVTFSTPAQRIVSLNPASTEILFTIGAGARVVGRTTWDSWPQAALAVPDLGPGLRPNVEAVLAARPDLVVLYAAQDNRAAARQFRAAGITTLTLRVDQLSDFARATMALGQAVGDTASARAVRDSVLGTVSRVAAQVRRARDSAVFPTVAWVLGEQPLYVLGASSFLGELIDSAGGRNAFGNMAQPSPQISFEELLKRAPDVVVVGGFGAARMTPKSRWAGLRAVREGRIVVADSMLTGRPGPRVGEATVWLAAAIAEVMRQPTAARGPR